MNQQLRSETWTSGRLLRGFGWFLLGVGTLAASFMLVPAISTGRAEALERLAAAVVAWLAVCIAYLAVGAALKRHLPWARWTGFGLACLAMFVIPIGTVVGWITVAHLIKGWREP